MDHEMEAVCGKMAQWILEDVQPEPSNVDVVVPTDGAARALAAAAEPQEDEGFCEV